jgi:hypothetical protein
MNLARVKAKLDAIIAEASTLKKEIEADAGELEAAPVYMSIVEYAKHALVSEKTVRNWVKAGLPVRRRGRVIRVKVVEADNWNEDDATRRGAELAAHGAKR